MKTILWNVFIFIAKVIGRGWIFAVIPFRGYARNYCQNYVLQNDRRHWLGRLWQREPERVSRTTTLWDGSVQVVRNGWKLHDVHDVSQEGFIKWRKVNKWMFYFLVFTVYGWLDDDANEDTTDVGYINTITVGPTGYRTNGVDRTHDLVAWLYAKRLPTFQKGEVRFGNAFDLGDIRAQYPYFNFWCTWVWNNRNTAMNFQYLWVKDYQ